MILRLVVRHLQCIIPHVQNLSQVTDKRMPLYPQSTNFSTNLTGAGWMTALSDAVSGEVPPQTSL